MRCAAIDLGTNTFHLVIADITASGIHIVYKENEPVKLGKGSINQNYISDAAFERGIAALTRFRATAIKYNVLKIRAVATSAVRSAQNGAAFISAAADKAGIKVELITGAEEAALIFEGVKASGAISGQSLIIDIGGGSTEFILCNEKGLLWKQSFDIGAARLMQAFFNSDPLSPSDKAQIIQHLDHLLAPLFEACSIHQPVNLVGSAGAFETFAEMLSPKGHDRELPSAPLPYDRYLKLGAQFLNSTHKERAGMEGLVPLRVDMIVMATLITNYVLDKTGIKNIQLSTYDLKIGVLQVFKQSMPVA